MKEIKIAKKGWIRDVIYKLKNYSN